MRRLGLAVYVSFVAVMIHTGTETESPLWEKVQRKHLLLIASTVTTLDFFVFSSESCRRRAPHAANLNVSVENRDRSTTSIIVCSAGALCIWRVSFKFGWKKNEVDSKWLLVSLHSLRPWHGLNPHWHMHDSDKKDNGVKPCQWRIKLLNIQLTLKLSSTSRKEPDTLSRVVTLQKKFAHLFKLPIQPKSLLYWFQLWRSPSRNNPNLRGMVPVAQNPVSVSCGG